MNRTLRLRQAVSHHRWVVLAIGAGVLGGLIVATLVSSPAPRNGLPPEPDAVDSAAIAPVMSGGAEPDGAAPTPSQQLLNGHVQPGELSIPDIGVRSSFVHLGLNPDGTLQVPKSYNIVGWYAAGPKPGDAGGPPAVFVGHVDSKAGPGVFFRLHQLNIGAEFVIGGVDGVDRHFRVYKKATYRKNAFPATQVYAASKKAEVRLITCTGAFDAPGGHYEDNLVVYAAIVGA